MNQFLSLFLCLLSLRDILDDASDAHDLSILVLYESILTRQGLLFHLSAIGALDLFDRRHLAGQFTQNLLTGQLFFSIEFPHRLADHFLLFV